MSRYFLYFLLCIGLFQRAFSQLSSYQSNFVENNGVKIHYVSKGEGPTMLFLHGFPDFWFSWIYQMEQFSSQGYKVVGVDLRGYNKSDKPEGVDNYKMSYLISDVVTVMNAVSPEEEVILVANDWGGAIAWQIASYLPQRVKYLVACNIPHPSSLFRHLKKDPSTAGYTEKFTSDNASETITIDNLMEMSGTKHDSLNQWYREAFEASSIESMLNYYKVSYPKPSATTSSSSSSNSVRKVKCPVLMIHGLMDKAFPPPTLNDHWDYIDNRLTIHTIPDAGHFIQREAPEEVYKVLKAWLYLNSTID